MLHFYAIVHDSRMSLSNVSLPIWHWCSPSVLPLTHPSPFSPKPALEEPRRTSHPERGGKIKSVFFFSNPTLLPLHDHQVLEPEVVQVEEKAQLLQVLLLLPQGRLSAGQLPKTQTRETLWGVQELLESLRGGKICEKLRLVQTCASTSLLLAAPSLDLLRPPLPPLHLADQFAFAISARSALCWNKF